MPDQDLIVSDSMKQIYKVLNQLPDNQRIAFTLSKMDGFNNLEIRNYEYQLLQSKALFYRAKRKLLLTYYTF
jgi:RNA polymerase sigma-70 factor (ECF subfamily)